MAMSPRKKEAGAGGSSRSVVNLGNGATKKPKKMRGGGLVGAPMMPKKPKKMRGRGAVGGPMIMKDGGGLQDMSGDGKITLRDRIMAARGEKPVKKMRGGPIKKNNGGPIKASKKSGVMRRMRGGPVKKKGG